MVAGAHVPIKGSSTSCEGMLPSLQAVGTSVGQHISLYEDAQWMNAVMRDHCIPIIRLCMRMTSLVKSRASCAELWMTSSTRPSSAADEADLVCHKEPISLKGVTAYIHLL